MSAVVYKKTSSTDYEVAVASECANNAWYKLPTEKTSSCQLPFGNYR